MPQLPLNKIYVVFRGGGIVSSSPSLPKGGDLREGDIVAEYLINQFDTVSKVVTTVVAEYTGGKYLS